MGQTRPVVNRVLFRRRESQMAPKRERTRQKRVSPSDKQPKIAPAVWSARRRAQTTSRQEWPVRECVQRASYSFRLTTSAAELYRSLRLNPIR